jgi:hypothetical protein
MPPPGTLLLAGFNAPAFFLINLFSFAMYSLYSLTLPDSRREEERLLSARRLLVAENIIDTLATNGTGPDASAISFLQQYVNGAVTLGQAIGRLVDHLAQSPDYEPQAVL